MLCMSDMVSVFMLHFIYFFFAELRQIQRTTTKAELWQIEIREISGCYSNYHGARNDFKDAYLLTLT